ncbi:MULTISPECIES: hypothetical protein [Rhodomicrobium]|uniref:hypothetical protein n=1 Tax=Rhodomicrobium TaxID=1068 RepID=UPI000B4BFEF1|nr:MULTISPECIES: hypothetical protein [Rhodomicrobium]
MDELSPLATELLRGVTDEMVTEAAGFREDMVEPRDAAAEGPSLESTPFPADWRASISASGYEFIVRWETGGKEYYEGVIKGRPIWPKFASGITIGCGFDLGYHTLAEFREQWGTRLGAADFGRLTATLGLKTVAPNREAKVARARAFVRSLSDIVVPWNMAIEQFDNSKYPKILRQLFGALDNVDKLHPHSRAALLSLTFNRGVPFQTPGERYAEMRAIHAAMKSGTSADFARIPQLLRDMQRIWGERSSLAERRRGEAKLFEAGLDEAGLAQSVASLQVSEAPAVLEAAPGLLSEEPEGTELEQTDAADDAQEAADFEAEGLESAGLTAASVHWNPKDDEQPDYRHLDTSLAGRSFELVPADLEALIAANEYEVRPGKVLFALRGASLGGQAKRESVASVVITDQRPDHRNFRCIIGVYDRTAKLLWAYQASTVPNADFVFKCFRQAQAGVAMDKLMGNILPTGCYTYTVGTHHPGKPNEIPTVLRLSPTATGASKVVVLRSLGDVIYDRFDAQPIAIPADNIHPGQKSSGFSSAGCLTLPGFFQGGQHSGIWKDFRAAAGITANSNGNQYSLLLFTGLDAAIAASVRDGEHATASLLRLRHGSQGPRVAALQSALGLAPDATQRLGPVTRQALIKKQTAKLGWADGIYSPAMDELLGFNIYALA